MSGQCEHTFGVGTIEDHEGCIVFVKCANCDLMATASGRITDLGGGYTVIDAVDRANE